MNHELKTTVTAFIFYHNKLLLIKHKKTGKWLPVGGHAEENETLDETLIREVREEVNLEIEFIEKYNYYVNMSPDKKFKELPRPFYIHIRNSENCRKMSFDFLCVTKNIDNFKILEEELDGYNWFTQKEIEQSSEIWEPIKILALNAFKTYDTIRDSKK